MVIPLSGMVCPMYAILRCPWSFPAKTQSNVPNGQRRLASAARSDLSVCLIGWRMSFVREKWWESPTWDGWWRPTNLGICVVVGCLRVCTRTRTTQEKMRSKMLRSRPRSFSSHEKATILILTKGRYPYHIGLEESRETTQTKRETVPCTIWQQLLFRMDFSDPLKLTIDDRNSTGRCTCAMAGL